jgi:hypothetical protein
VVLHRSATSHGERRSRPEDISAALHTSAAGGDKYCEVQPRPCRRMIGSSATPMDDSSEESHALRWRTIVDFSTFPLFQISEDDACGRICWHACRAAPAAPASRPGIQEDDGCRMLHCRKQRRDQHSEISDRNSRRVPMQAARR